MTRQEFIDDITTWSELIEFCHDESIEFCDNVYNDVGYDSCIMEELDNFTRDESWQDIKNWLCSLPDGYDYYIRDDEWGTWKAADDDEFDYIKDSVLEYMDDNSYWEDDSCEEEEESEEYIDPEDEVPVEDEDISFAELFTTCNSKVQKIESDKIANVVATEQAETIAFDELCVSVGITVTAEGSN